MDMELELRGQDADEQMLFALQDWLWKSGIDEIEVHHKTTPPKPGHMGVEPATILSVILGSAAVVQLVKSIHVWLSTRQRKLQLILKIENMEMTINAENLNNQEELLESAMKLAKALRGK